MGASHDNSSTAADKQTVDLSELQSLSFGPNWTDRKSSDAPKARSHPGRDAGKGPAKDRRKGARPERKGPAGERPRGDRRPPHRDDRSSQPPRDDFKPIVEVTFYPEDIPFKALSHAMKSNCRTYELFEVARLILDKPERFVVVLHPLKQADGTLPKEFYVSVPDGLPFFSEDAVMAHVLKHHAEHYFSTEEAETEPPKGNFVSVGKCGITGELLGPPNYHRYQSLLQEHHAARLPNMPFEKFLSKIEQVKEPEAVEQWMSKMTKVTRYRPIEPAEGDPEYLDGMEAARLFLLTKRRDQVVRKADHARFPGKAMERLPKGDLRRSVEASLDYQRRFPLETANNLRGRLRRMRFTIYKRGSKGVSYVCAVKRNFREPDTKLADSPQALIEFIEQNAGISLSDLPAKFLGINPEKAIKADQEKAPDIEEVPREEAEAIVEEHELRRQQKQAEAAQAAEGQAEVPTDTAPPEGAPVEAGVEPAEEAVAHENASQPEPTVEVESAQATSSAPQAETPVVADPRLRQLMVDLHWLVHEGYVVEFGDGSLQAVPYAPAQNKKAQEPQPVAQAEPAEVSSPAEPDDADEAVMEDDHMDTEANTDPVPEEASALEQNTADPKP